MKYLSPKINKSPFTEEEDDLLIEKYNSFGPRWVKISKFFRNRTDSALKNRWNVLARRHGNSSDVSSSTQTSISSPVSEPDSDYDYSNRSQRNRNSKKRKLSQKTPKNKNSASVVEVKPDNSSEDTILSIFDNFEATLDNFNFGLDIFNKESFDSF